MDTHDHSAMNGGGGPLVPREAEGTARTMLRGFPVLVITGPRQSGKSTLARMLRPESPYRSLEDPDTREFACSDPRGFFDGLADGAVLDEVQRAPELFSYLQGVVDARRAMGRFILTGSSQFEMLGAITQSLAGRAGLLTLLPFALGELQGQGREPQTVDELLYRGLFPPVYDRPVEPVLWHQNYIATYLERDVRQVLQVRDTVAFQRFVELCAGRVGQLLNVSSLAADAGVTRVTASAWLSALETSHLIFLVRPWSRNRSKRLIKTPKLYFCDPGLASWLLGVRRREHLHAHPQRGALFENWALTELLKAQTNLGRKPSLYFLRDKQGHEIDAVVEAGPKVVHGVEVKSGATVAADFFKGVEYWRERAGNHEMRPWLVYGGKERQQRQAAMVVPWLGVEELLEAVRAG